jgi:hypothetical protein
LGVEDLIKTITFSVYDHNNMLVNHNLNQISIEISKHLGLVKTVNFYYFEHITDNFYHFDEFYLIGINEPQLGFQNINLREQYYDFQIGDEFHIWDIEDYFLSYSSEKKIINRYLSRNDYEDSILYFYERKIYSEIKTFIDGTLNVEISTSIDTVKQNIVKGLLFYTEPNELDGVYKVMIVNNELPKMYMFSYDFIETEGPCLIPSNVDAYYSLPTYYLGLGGPFYAYCEIFHNKQGYELVYYKKGDIKIGTPFDFNVSIPNNKKDNSFSIFPNPANNYITIQCANNDILDNSIIEIYDIQGRKHFSKDIKISKQIDISFLKSGYYLVKIIQKNENISYFKFVKL